MPARTKARKRAVDVLYEADQRAVAAGTDPGRPTPVSVLAERITEPGTQAALPEYAVEIVEGFAAHAERIDEVLSSFSQGWTLERMPTVDRAILRVGAWEVLYNDDVPDAVAIDEAVGLARSLSTDESPGFVNGLLGRISELGPSLVD
ncbi:transcription antitermination factor NusB [Ruania halotolerans]|uniref:transcription antitermination factor NusB n=1 Tax=Ruania halotolerans TaxID=2897773 RepID=UPI001E548D9D|nr:transcription antitermination factor NusB [Ruania halotolerans]UFU04734.1 transcription antitermination factor NusB [Ruania halotolerans]